TGGNYGLHYYINGGFRRLVDTTMSATVAAENGVTFSGGKVRMQGSLIEYTPIGTGSYPLTMVQNGYAISTLPDSAGIWARNNTAAATTTDSNSARIFRSLVYARKTLPASSVPMEFDLVTTGLGSSAGNASLNFRARKNSGAWATALSLDAGGYIRDSISITGVIIGPLTGGSFRIGGQHYALSSGGLNLSIGSGALNIVASGAENTAISTNSLSLNVSGNDNTAVGYRSQQSTTTSFNTSLGANSLLANTSGEQLTAIGYNALLANTTGIKNVADGAGAGENNTTGSFNMFGGMDAGLQNTTGSENTDIGYLGGSQNRTGSYNVWVGSSSGRGILNGNYNIGIGRNTQYGAYGAGDYDQNDTLDNSIAIGAGVNTTKSNQTILGNAGIVETKIRGAIYTTDTTGITLWGQRATDSAMVRLPSGLWGGGGGGSSALSSITAATTTNTIDNGGNQQTWDFNSLTTEVGGLRLRTSSVTSGALFRLTSTSTAATGNTQNVLEVNTSGANANSTQTTYASTFTNSHTGTASTNIAGYFNATGGSSNYAVRLTDGSEGAGKLLMSDASGNATWATVTGSGTTAVLSTSPTFTTSIISPLVYGGTGTGSTLTLQSTSGVGATDYIAFKTGNNVEAARINTGQELLVGTTSDAGAYKAQIAGDALITSASSPKLLIRNTAGGGESMALLAGTALSIFAATPGGFGIEIAAEGSFGGGSTMAMVTNGTNFNTAFGNFSYTTDMSSQLGVISSSSTKVAFKARAAASTSVNLIEGQNSASTNLFTVGPTGLISFATGSAMPKAIGSLKQLYTTVGNVGAGEDDLQTYSIPAGTLATDGDYIDFVMSFSVAVNSTLKVYYGATQLFSYAALATDAVYRVTGQIVRTGAATQRATFVMTAGGATVVTGYQTPTETLSGAVTLKATGQGTSNNDIVQTLTLVNYHPSN
ncbi:MAG: hypothetical protein JNK14_10395, partial [Chitinophagaceae bacterium]|nr:hypothetical protein [Chitinophagaceae bacterium]